MPRNARIALSAATAGIGLLALVWWLSHDVAFVRKVDADVLSGFLTLQRPRLDRLTNAIARLCNPSPYVFLAAVPIIVALLRGRPRVAVMLAILLIGANETTELLKPLAAGARDPIPGGWRITSSSWPSGHATASMSLAFAAVISAPSRRRPLVAAAMAAFVVAIVFSFLELGWHYPSDVVGGFLVASVWTLIGLAALWTYESHRPALAHHTGVHPPAFSVGQALRPAGLMIGVALLFAVTITATHPHAVIDYARVHTVFVVAAAAIAGCAFSLASALSLLLRGSGRAPTAARPARWPAG